MSKDKANVREDASFHRIAEMEGLCTFGKDGHSWRPVLKNPLSAKVTILSYAVLAETVVLLLHLLGY